MSNDEDKTPPDGVVETIDYVNGVEFPCHVCGKVVQAGTEEDGRMSIVHKMPICDKFRDMDPVDFITESRQHYQRAMMN